jgi:hypothetical protein
MVMLQFATPKAVPVPPKLEPAVPIPATVQDVPRWPGFALFGASVALFGTAGLMWGLGRSEYADLRDGCGRSGACSSADLSASRTKLIVGDVALGVGIVSLGASLYWLLFHSHRADGVKAARIGAEP